jgi:hypothetical protein
MPFTIEVPGEANPLTPQQVYHALQSASSSTQLSIQTGTQQLQNWETQRGYYTLLQVWKMFSKSSVLWLWFVNQILGSLP